MMFSSGRVITLLVLTLLLSACGGGGGGSSAPAVAPGGGSSGGGTGGSGGGGSGGGSGTQPSVEIEGGVSGTGLNVGPVQGFSSVIVNGLAMDVSNATIRVEGAVADQSALREGQGVLVVGDLQSLEAVELRYRAQIRGPVTDLAVIDPLIGTADLTVFGQPVRLNAATLYYQTQFGLVQTGDVLEVSGSVNNAGVLAASYVEIIDNPSEYKVVGPIDMLTSSTLTMGGLAVDFSSATLNNFNGNAISSTDVVEARGAVGGFTAPDQFNAEVIERIPQVQVNDGADVEIEGFVTSTGGASDFVLAGQPVAVTPSTVYELGAEDDVSVDDKVVVAGQVNSSGILVATRITFRPLQAVRVEGPIEAIDLTDSTVQSLGLTFAVRGTTVLEDDSSLGIDPLVLADLMIGDFVEARGFLEGQQVVAAELERDDSDPRSRLRGPITALNSGVSTLSLLDVPIVTSGSTQYEDDDDNVLSQAEFFALLDTGIFVEARWDNFVTTSEPVDQLSLEDDD